MSDARILDRGYRRYDGPRLGPTAAFRSIVVQTIRRVLGLRRPARAKVLPVIVILIAYVPAVVIVGLTAIFNDIDTADLPTYAGYYGFVSIAILLFVTFVSPEALCPDRRTKLLGQYLAAPVTRAAYLAAKVTAVMIVLFIVTLGPQLLMLLAFSLQGSGPDGIDDWLSTLARILASGFAFSAILALPSLAVSSFTDRKAFASVGFIVFATVSSVAGGVLYGDGGDGVKWAGLLSLTGTAIEVVMRIFGAPAECFSVTGECDELVYPGVSTVTVAAGALLWVGVSVAVMWSRYRKLEVA